MLSLSSICDWAGSNPSQRKFVEGERIYKAGHIIKCGKNVSSNSDTASFTAICLQTSSLREKPHEINGEVSSDGKILQCSCSCKAGRGEKCKHIIAALLYIYQKGDALEDLSCTDKKCQWKAVHKKALENYNPAPLMQHSCFATPMKRKKIISASLMTEYDEGSEDDEQMNQVLPNCDSDVTAITPVQLPAQVELSEPELHEITLFIANSLPSSALAKHLLGRHNAFVMKEKSTVSQVQKEVIEFILKFQDNDLMRSINTYSVDVLHKCCSKTLDQLSLNLQEVCEKTKDSYAHWMHERQCRITGSICYGLYTYTKKDRSDAEMENKCKSTFTPKNFKTEATEHGKITESKARDAFREVNIHKFEVIEVGLIVSRLNPWLAFSPDGIIIRDKKPTALLEIKCPLKGKNKSIEETVDSQLGKCLLREGENIVMKEKHPYYGQIQLGMAVLNVNLTYFVIYSPFDRKMFTLRVARNESFTVMMLKALKKVYYSFKLHDLCIEKGNCDVTTQKSAEV